MLAPSKISVNLPMTLDIVERAALVALFAFMTWSFLDSGREIYSIVSVLLLVSEGSVLVFALIRRFAREMSMDPADWMFAFLGTVAPLLVRPVQGAEWAPALVCAPLMLAGFALQIAAKLTLRRSFGLVAANRGVKINGPYRFIRHPMYAGYVMTQLGFFLTNPTAWNAAVYSVAFMFQVRRMLAEERLLSRDAAYCSFAATVPYRLVPHVF